MDIDAYVDAHRGTWGRLEQLTKRPGSLRGEQLDELVDLYQRTATHLSVIRTESPDPQLITSLTALVARSRAAVTGRRTVGWSAIPEFFLRTFPAVVWRIRYWWLGVAASTTVISLATAAWLATHADIRARLLSASDRSMIENEFLSYYTDHPHGSFAAQVWTHNALIAALSLAFGFLLGIPTISFIVSTGFQVGVPAGYLIAEGKTGEFLTHILPHGMLELSAVFLAMGGGLKLGWTVVDPGPRTRVRAIAEEGRAMFALALGCGVMLLCSGIIEGFVTPATVIAPWVKLVIGGLAVSFFTVYLVAFGRRAVREGFTGDISEDLRGDLLPEAA